MTAQEPIKDSGASDADIDREIDEQNERLRRSLSASINAIASAILDLHNSGIGFQHAYAALVFHVKCSEFAMESTGVPRALIEAYRRMGVYEANASIRQKLEEKEAAQR